MTDRICTLGSLSNVQSDWQHTGQPQRCPVSHIQIYRTCNLGSLSDHLLHHLQLSPNREGVWGTTDDFTTSFVHFSVLYCPLRLGELLAYPFPDVVFLPLLLSALSSSPFHFTVPCNTVLARPHEQEMSIRLHFVSLYDGSLNACWILAWTPLLVTCSLYEMCSILRSTSFSWLVFFFAALLWGSMINKHTGRWLW